MSIQASLVVAQQAAQASLAVTAAASTLAAGQAADSSAGLFGDEFSRGRFVVAGRTVSLAALIAGCSSPHPDGLERTDAQQASAPAVQTEYYQSQVAVMDRMREEGHHGDQALFGIGIGAALFFGLLVGFVFGRRSGRKSAERAALRPPPAPQSSGPGFMRGVGE